MLSSRTDFFVDMSGQISSRRGQLSTKQWSGNKCSDVPTKIQTSNYAMDNRAWPGKQWLMPLHSLDSALFANSQAFLKAYLSIFSFLNEFVLFQNSSHYHIDKTESLSTCSIFSKLLFCRQFCRQIACRRQHYKTNNFLLHYHGGFIDVESLHWFGGRVETVL